MYNFPKFIKAKRYRRRKTCESNIPSWEITSKNYFIRSSDINFFSRWQENPQYWVVKWYDYNKKKTKKIAKFYLVDDSTYCSYFEQYDGKPHVGNELDYLII